MQLLRTIGVLLVSGIVLTGFACSSGGSSGGTADAATAGATPTVGFNSASAGTQEGGSDVSVSLTLDLPGDPLEQELRIGVTPGSTSTATQGSDYTLSGSTLTFPVGSADGATQSVMLSPLDDASLEGMETVDLELDVLQGSITFGISTLRVSLTDSDSGTLEFDSASSATADEASGSHTIDIALDVPSGASLADALTITVSDTGTGTASIGNDYSSFGTQNVVITAGSSSGIVASVTVDALNDATLEGDETVVLQLTVPASPVTAGSVLTHTVTITDDDPSGSGALTILADGAHLVHQGTVDLDVAGPGGPELTVQNTGTGDVTLTHPEITTGDVRDFTVHLETGALEPSEMQAEPEEVASPLLGVSEATASGVAARFDAETLVDVKDRDDLLLMGFPLPDLGDVTLKLDRIDSPWTPDAVVRVDGVERSIDSVSALANLTFWRGKVVGDDQSHVFLSISENGCRGWVECDALDGGLAHVSTQRGKDGEAPDTQRVSLNRHQPPLEQLPQCAGLVARPGQQVTDLDPAELLPEWHSENHTDPGADLTALPDPPDSSSEPESDGTPQISELTLSNVVLAVETDYEYYAMFMDVDAAVLYVTELLAAVSELYQRDVHTTLSISYIGVYTNPSDPWTSTATSTSTGDLLDEFVNAWSTDGWPATADLAHFVSGATDLGGIAYVDVLCRQDFGFGVSGVLGNVNWSSFDFETSATFWDFTVIAHELGHNFGAVHTHEYCPPLDQCLSNCSGSTACSTGTLMSYCHFCGGLSNIDMRFHPTVANIMRANVNASSCASGIVLEPGDTLRYNMTFTPTSSGAKSATVEMQHSAGNVPSPFEFTLTGGGGVP